MRESSLLHEPGEQCRRKDKPVIRRVLGRVRSSWQVCVGGVGWPRALSPCPLPVLSPCALSLLSLCPLPLPRDLLHPLPRICQLLILSLVCGVGSKSLVLSPWC